MRSSASLRSAIDTTLAPPDPVRGRPARGALWLLAACLAWLPALPLCAQSTQYTAPGGGESFELPTAESIEASMEEARWRLGPFRLAPWLGLRGLTYEQDVFVDNQDVDGEEGDVSDVTGSLGAGLTAYLPTGDSVFWIVQAMPEYVFWLDLSERNELIGRYGAGVVADLNRLRLVADVYRREEQRVVTVESPQQVLAERNGVAADAALSLTGNLALTAAFRAEEVLNRRPGDDGDPEAGVVGGGDDLSFSRVDREERSLETGIRYQPRDGVRFGIGVEWTEADFEGGARNLGNTGTSPYLDFTLEGNKIDLDGRATYRELEPETGSALLPVEELNGRARVRLTPGWRFAFDLYAHRNFAYSLSGAYSHLIEDRFGVGVGAPFGERLRTRAFFESGTADYRRLGPEIPQRSDDITAYGFDATYALGEWLDYRAGFHQLDFDSNLSEFDRDFVRITSNFILSTADWTWR